MNRNEIVINFIHKKTYKDVLLLSFDVKYLRIIFKINING